MKDILLTLLLFELIFNKAEAQAFEYPLSLSIIETKIDTGNRLYFFNEIHMDNLDAYYKKYYVDEGKKSTVIFYNYAYKYLYDSCNVRNFLFEAPLSYEYFFRKYLQTGDSTWLYIIDGYDMVKIQLSIVRKLNVTNEINIHCIDRDSRWSSNTVGKLLFLYAFYEPFITEDIEGISNGTESDSSADFFDAIYRDRDSFCKECNNVKELISNFEYSPKSKKLMKVLFEELTDLDTNTAKQQIYKSVLKDNYYQFEKVKDSYLTFYNEKKMENPYSMREEFMFSNVTNIIEKDTTVSSYGQFGFSHGVPRNSANQTLLQKLNQKFTDPNDIYSALLFYPMFDIMYPTTLFTPEQFAKLSLESESKWQFYSTDGFPEIIITIK